MNFWLSPLQALYSISFYQKVTKEPVAKGLRYLLYLTLLTTFATLLSFQRGGLPIVRGFMDWLKVEMPILTVTQAGLSMEEESPLTLIHPDFGPIVTFDLGVQNPADVEMGDVFLFVTSKQLYIRQTQEQFQAYDVAQVFGTDKRAPGEVAFITPESVEQFYQRSRPVLFFLLGTIFFFVFFIWKVIAGFFYAWFGLLFNMGRRERLTFGAIYHVSLVAMTASIMIQWFRFLFPFLNRLPFIDFLVLMVTGTYLFFGITRTQELSE